MSFLQPGILCFLGTNYNYYFMNQSFTTGFSPKDSPTSDEKMIALLSHILTFVAPILAPLIIYLVKKDESEFVASHSLENGDPGIAGPDRSFAIARVASLPRSPARAFP